MRIAIDPGHGMSNRQLGIYDPGATHLENGHRFEEASIALKYGLALRDELRAQQISTFMTRDDAEDHASVAMRAKRAKESGCDVLISFHMNDFEDDAANGLEVLYRGEASRSLAEGLQTALVGITALRDRQVKERRDLAVLKFDGPAVLIELGFIANDRDREVILNTSTRERVCRAIVDEVLTFVGSAARRQEALHGLD